MVGGRENFFGDAKVQCGPVYGNFTPLCERVDGSIGLKNTAGLEWGKAQRESAAGQARRIQVRGSRRVPTAHELRPEKLAAPCLLHSLLVADAGAARRRVRPEGLLRAQTPLRAEAQEVD